MIVKKYPNQHNFNGNFYINYQAQFLQFVMSYLKDNEDKGRIILPDLVRAFALFGIVLVNVAFFAYPGEITYHAGGLNGQLDNAAYFGVNAFFLFKSYTLFSFMFGVGLSYQMASAERRGTNFSASYFRRMLGLILLGVLHVTLAFIGDILIVYGVLGMILFLFRNAKQKTLLRTGIALVVLQVFIALLFSLMMYMGETHAPEEMIKVQNEINSSIETAWPIYANGSFLEVVDRRWLDWAGYIAYAMPLQAPGVLGFFLLGFAATRANILSDPAATIWSKARTRYLPFGILLSLIGAYLYMSAPGAFSSRGMLGFAVIFIAAPFSSIGYIGVIAKWSQGPATTIKTFAARGGTASLTAYLMQSLILSFIFCGYGFGLYREIGAFSCTLIAIATGIFSIAFVSWWRTKYKRGPMEILLRRWTYMTQTR